VQVLAAPVHVSLLDVIDSLPFWFRSTLLHEYCVDFVNLLNILEICRGWIYIPPPPRPLECNSVVRAALHLEAGPIPIEADCMKFQPFLGWRPASTTHYNKIITGG